MTDDSIPAHSPPRPLPRGVVALNAQSAWVPVGHTVYPSMARRWVAGFIDLALVATLLPAAWIASWPLGKDPDLPIHVGASLTKFGLLAIVLGWIYTVSQQCGPLRVTLGERLMRLMVSDLRGNPLIFSAASLRYVGTVLNLLCMGIPTLTALRTRRLQAWHEQATHSVVVDRQSTHSHIRAYARRMTAGDAAVVAVSILMLSSVTQVEVIPWVSSLRESIEVDRALKAIEVPLNELHNGSLWGEGPPTQAVAAARRGSALNEMYVGPTAKAGYLGQGQIEVKFTHGALQAHRIVVQATRSFSEHARCVFSNVAEDLLPRWCRRASTDLTGPDTTSASPSELPVPFNQ